MNKVRSVKLAKWSESTDELMRCGLLGLWDGQVVEYSVLALLCPLAAQIVYCQFPLGRALCSKTYRAVYLSPVSIPNAPKHPL